VRNPIDDAIAALRRGDQSKAFALLRGRLTQDSKDATAWLWMSEATPDIHRKIEALERFMSLAPDHPRVPSAHARLEYLESQVAKLPPEPRPPVVIEYEEKEPEIVPPPGVKAQPTAPEPTRPTPPSESTIPFVSPITPARQRESLLSGMARSAPDATPPMVEHAPVVPPPSMTVQSSPVRTSYQPAMPDLLQSLLDTAHMPRVRTDLPRPPLDTAPRRLVLPPTPLDVPDEALPTEDESEPITIADEVVAPVSNTRATPRWAWALIVLMAIQIVLLLYIILRVELVLATVG